jgi:hypothetical protein
MRKEGLLVSWRGQEHVAMLGSAGHMRWPCQHKKRWWRGYSYSVGRQELTIKGKQEGNGVAAHSGDEEPLRVVGKIARAWIDGKVEAAADGGGSTQSGDAACSGLNCSSLTTKTTTVH